MWWLVVEDAKVFLFVNGRRARSRNSDYTFEAVTAADSDSSNPEHVLFRFEDGKSTNGKLNQLDRFITSATLHCNLADLTSGADVARATNILLTTMGSNTINLFDDSSTNATQSSSTDSLEESSDSPLMDITNYSEFQAPPKKKRRGVKDKGLSKRRAICNDNDAIIDASIAKKCRGNFVVPLGSLNEPSQEFQRRRTHQEVLQIKEKMLNEKTNLQDIHMIPVQCKGRYDENTNLEVLGGSLCCYVLGAKDMVEDERFRNLRDGWRVKVFEDLTRMEALRVGNLYANHQILQTSTSFEEQADMCRKILYEDNGRSEEEEPPMMRGPTRKRCALALGKKIELNALRALEPTFQLASYSRRCYKKAQELFTSYREKKRKQLSQFWFMKLQGLEEETRYQLLVSAVTDLDLKKMAAAAEMRKKKCHVQEAFVKGVEAASWADACERFPEFTTATALEPYLGLKFKKGNMPTSFVSFVRNAKSNVPDENRAAMAFNVISKADDLNEQMALSQEARTSVYFCEDVKDVGSTLLLGQGEKRSMLNIINKRTEDITGNHIQAEVKYAVICGPSALSDTVVFMDEQEVLQYLIEKFSSEKEVVLDNMQRNGAVAREACELGRKGKVQEMAKDHLEGVVREADLNDLSSIHGDSTSGQLTVPDSEDSYIFKE